MERERHEVVGYCSKCGEVIREWDKLYGENGLYACWMCDQIYEEKILDKKER